MLHDHTVMKHDVFHERGHKFHTRMGSWSCSLAVLGERETPLLPDGLYSSACERVQRGDIVMKHNL